MTARKPSADEARVIAWLRGEAGKSEDARTIVTLTRAAHYIERGDHRND